MGTEVMQRYAIFMADQWWLIVLRGVVAVVFGITAWVWPDATLYTLVLIFGFYAIVGGAMSLAAGYARRRESQGVWPIAQGLLAIAWGVVVIAWPDLSALALLYIIGAWALVTGAMEVVAAIELRKAIQNEWLLALAGLGSIAFGIIVLIFPGDGALALVWTIGVYAIAFGMVLIALGLRLRTMGSSTRATS